MAKRTGLAPEQLRALDRLKHVKALRPFYLAEGSAVAFHLQHRTSEDLDLFARRAQQGLRSVERALTQAEPGTEVVSATDAAISLRWGSVPIDLVDYPYPLLERTRSGPAGFPVAGKTDLATMKLAAVARRGIRRDFWDLFALVNDGLPLERALNAYQRRFKKHEPDTYHLVVALTWFGDAEKERVFPAGMTVALWNEIKRFFRAEAPRLLKPPKRRR